MNCILRSIPNSITCLNLFSGCLSCVMASMDELVWAMVFLCLAALFDFLDGFSARLLKAYSDLGKELDSLADVVSFGVAPSFMLYSMFGSWFSAVDDTYDHLIYLIFPYVAFLIAVFSGLRLAKFNIDTRQSESFIGLPVPANALFWASLVVGGGEWLFGLPYREVLLLLLICFSCWILVSELPMFALKFKNFSWKTNKLRYFFVFLSALCVIFAGVVGISCAVVLYVLLSLWSNKRSN